MGVGAILAARCTADTEDSGAIKKPVAVMSLEELVNIEVTSASKKREPRLEATAAIFVITQEDIRRSGVTTLVEALRLAPGVTVARINASQWAVGIRGFTSQFSRAVLVLIDGRSVYTPLFAGVFWAAQDTLLEDVDRIEVIRGPGGTLWGANAVDGVINIITRGAADTQGGLLGAEAGSQYRANAGGRYGGTLDEKTAFRVYGKYTDRAAERHPDGIEFDGWHMAQGGFRADRSLSASDMLTLQGDAYTSRDGQRATPSAYVKPFISTVDADAKLSGANALLRFTHAREDGSEVVLKGYYDLTDHAETIFTERRDTVDFELQDRRHLGVRQELTYGIGFRWSSSDTTSIPTVAITPARRADDLYSAFVQDEISFFSRRLRLTLGTKLEHNDYTGFELQPTIRVLFTPLEGHYAWAAVSRAVRTPSLVEFDVSRSTAIGPATPAYFRLTGDGNFVSEKTIAYEAGYRVRFTEHTAADVAAFYNDLSDLTSGEPAGKAFVEGQGPSLRIILPFVFRNGLEGRTRGAEIGVDTSVAGWLTVRASYSYLSIDLRNGPGSVDTTSVANAEGSSPRHTASLAGYANLPSSLEVDGVLRFTDRLPAQGVDSAFDLDLHVGWRPASYLELSLVGQGLLRPQRLEFAGGESGNVEIQRAVYGKVTWRF